jgi:hypothetical protein
MDPIAFKRSLSQDLKKYAGKGMADDMKRRHGMMPAEEPLPDAALSVEIETAPVEGVPDESKPAAELSTEELLAILGERLETEKGPDAGQEEAPVPELEGTENPPVEDEKKDKDDEYA